MRGDIVIVFFSFFSRRVANEKLRKVLTANFKFSFSKIFFKTKDKHKWFYGAL